MIPLALRVWYSVTARLVVLFLLIGGTGFILLLTLSRLYFDNQSRPLSNEVPFLTYLSEQLAPDASAEQVELLMAKTIYLLRIVQHQVNNQTISQPTNSLETITPQFNDLVLQQTISPSVAYYTSANDSRYLVIDKAGHHYIFGYRFNEQKDNAYQLVAVLIPLLTVLLFVLGGFIAGRLFIPLSWIRKGAARIGEGDLSYRIEYKRKDELGQLVDVVNQMAQDLEQIFDSKRQLMLAISHELRSPLTRMKVNVELLNASPVASRLVGDIDEMRNIVEGLLVSERLQGAHGTLEKELVDPAKLIGDIVKEYIGPGGVKFSHSCEAVKVALDVSKIKFLLRNLINNSIKYTDTQTAQVDVKLEITNKDIRVSVTDNGCGIGEEHLAQIFSPFYRADRCRGRQTGGVGLGLYLCLLIAKAHDGDIFVRSTLGQGSRFHVVLPLETGAHMRPVKIKTKIPAKEKEEC